MLREWEEGLKGREAEGERDRGRKRGGREGDWEREKGREIEMEEMREREGERDRYLP